MTDDEIIAVVQAYKEGKTIQVVGKWEADKEINWRDVQFPEWQFGTSLYRVKPEPRKPKEFWIGRIENKFGTSTFGWEICEYPTVGFMHVREVIE